MAIFEIAVLKSDPRWFSEDQAMLGIESQTESCDCPDLWSYFGYVNTENLTQAA